MGSDCPAASFTGHGNSSFMDAVRQTCPKDCVTGQAYFRGIERMTMATPQADEMIIMTSSDRVACNGGGGALGHPQVWLTLGSDGKVTCPYCSRRYVRRPDEADE